MKIVIVGGGQVGEYIAHLLLENGCQVSIIEQRENIVAHLNDSLPADSIYVGDGADPKTLERAGIGSADVMVAVSGADEVNLVASTIGKFEFGVPRIIARVNNPKNEWLYDQHMGVDVRLSQANLLAHLVVDEIDFKNIITLIKLDRGENSIIQLAVDPSSSAVHQQVQNLPLPDNALLVAIQRKEETLIPKGDTEILAGDHIIAFTSEEHQNTLNQLFCE